MAEHGLVRRFGEYRCPKCGNIRFIREAEGKPRQELVSKAGALISNILDSGYTAWDEAKCSGCGLVVIPVDARFLNPLSYNDAERGDAFPRGVDMAKDKYAELVCGGCGRALSQEELECSIQEEKEWNEEARTPHLVSLRCEECETSTTFRLLWSVSLRGVRREGHLSLNKE